MFYNLTFEGHCISVVLDQHNIQQDGQIGRRFTIWGFKPLAEIFDGFSHISNVVRPIIWKVPSYFILLSKATTYKYKLILSQLFLSDNYM